VLLMLIACFIGDEDVDRALDPDGDGFGPEADCAPMDPAVYPGAEEVCGDGVVNDCEMDEAGARARCRLNHTISLADADLKLVGEQAGDQAGRSVAGAGDVDGDGRVDLLVGSIGAGAGGAAYLLLSSGALMIQDPSLSLTSADLKAVGEHENDYLGQSVRIIGDIDGDLLADWVVSAHYNDGEGEYANVGAIYLYRSSGLKQSLTTGAVAVASRKWIGEQSAAHFGHSTAPVGDVDGDELADLIVGAYAHDGGAVDSGAAYLLLSSGALRAEQTSSDTVLADCKLNGEAHNDQAGISVAGAGDVDGDTQDDLLVGARFHDGGGDGAGAAYLLLTGGTFSPTCGTMRLADADLTLYGEAPGDVLGEWLSSAGDVDGDGNADLLIGAHGHDGGGLDNTGATYLLLSDGLESTLGSMTIIDVADLKIIGGREGDGSGYPVASAGDVDGDGLADLLIGARYEDRGAEDAGAAYLLYASGLPLGAGATLDLRDADLKLFGESAGDSVSSGLASAGDVNGDGLQDLLIGALLNDAGGDDAGAAYLIYGRSF
jgi:hypothetical protein